MPHAEDFTNLLYILGRLDWAPIDPKWAERSRAAMRADEDDEDEDRPLEEPPERSPYPGAAGFSQQAIIPKRHHDAILEMIDGSANHISITRDHREDEFAGYAVTSDLKAVLVSEDGDRAHIEIVGLTDVEQVRPLSWILRIEHFLA